MGDKALDTTSSKQGFFGLHSAYDLLNKLGRDWNKLEASTNPDTLFNFFVTAWSIHDWVKEERPDLVDALNTIYGSTGPLFYCREIGNKAKHFRLRNNRTNEHPDPTSTIASVGAFASQGLNDVDVNGGRLQWQLYYADRLVIEDAVAYALSSVHELVDFFKRHGIAPDST
ncbi:hypothetical protein A7J71_18180 [Achromobacter insolitus]|nr:hypothetical protein A7J71_18180 [Achromobacter insolitus]OCZ50620.1 hypothetical protein A7P22_15160 [Achromobacter insolitus]